jgi:PhnB protein
MPMAPGRPGEPVNVTPYLYFKGACEEALLFYVRCGLGEIRSLQRYEGTPMAGRATAEWSTKVLHAELEGAGVRLFASDGADSEPMKGCALLIELENVERARALFEALSTGGRVTVPFDEKFWGWYGNFTDRFGVQWAVLVRP